MPITDLPTVELTDDNADGDYEGFYDGFTMSGTYRITIYAADTNDIYSLPKSTSVTQTVGSGIKGDVNGDTEIDLSDAVIALKLAVGLTAPVRQDYVSAEVDVNGDGCAGIAEGDICSPMDRVQLKRFHESDNH